MTARQLALTVAVVCLAATLGDAAFTMPLSRRPHRFVAGHQERPGGRAAGNTIPMSGGVVTLGSYFTEITVGTGAGQISFQAIVDTGSSNLALPAAGCTTCGTNQLYNATASPTAKPLSCASDFCRNCVPTAVGNVSVPANGLTANCQYVAGDRGVLCSSATSQCPFAISYGGTSSITAGTITTDVVCFGSSSTPLCATAFVGQQTAQYPDGTQNTGLVGLAYPANACNPTCQPTFLDSLVGGGVLAADKNFFGMCLTPTSGGAIDLGYLNTSRYNPAAMRYTKVVKEHWYNIVVKDVQVNGTSLGLPPVTYGISNDAIGAFPDSGTSIFLVSPLAMQSITAIVAQSFAKVPFATQLFQSSSLSNNACEDFGDDALKIISQFPTLQVILEGDDGKGDITIEVVPSSYLLNVGAATYCLGIAGVPSIGVILGDVVMENYYIHFDRVGRRVGFAPILSCQ